MYTTYTTSKPARLRPNRKGRAMGRGRKWVGILVILVGLLLVSAVPGHTDGGGHGFRGHGFRGGHGFKGHGFRGHGHRHWHRSGGVRFFISPSLIVPFGGYWGPRWELYAYPPVVVAPSPRVYVQPAPPPPVSWYYCEAAQAYYPYVQQCPGGWRAVTPTPP